MRAWRLALPAMAQPGPGCEAAVPGGYRVQFAGREDVRIRPGAWHTLRLRLEGDRFMVWFDGASQGAPLFQAQDGRIAGSHTLFELPATEVLR